MTSRAQRKRDRRRQRRRAVAKSEEPVDRSFRIAGRDAKVVKVDSDLGLVIGWAVICTEHGEDYFDKQGDHVEENALVEAVADFMENSRVAKEMHRGRSRGNVVFAFPLTADIAKSLGIETSITGLLVGMRPDKDMLEKYRSGELTGFSIGGGRLLEHEVN